MSAATEAAEQTSPAIAAEGPGRRPPPRIAVAGVAIESSERAAHRAGRRDFTVVEGPEVVARRPFLAPDTELGRSAEWIGVLSARSIPGGRVEAGVYAELRDRLVEGVARAAAEGLDAVLLEVHGAMRVVGMDDAEGDLVEALRARIGPGPLIAAPMDLHGNLSERFVAGVDLPTCYRTAPHEDEDETRERSARHLVEWLARGGRPVRALVPIPMLLPGEKTSTRIEPARGLYASIPGLAAREGVTDAALWIGYAWADEPRCHANALASGSDETAVRRAAAELAEATWAAREEFEFVGPTGTLDQALAAARAHLDAGGAQPYLISDSGDNPGAGGSGDVTWTLARLLENPWLAGPDAPLVYVASIFDEQAIARVWRAGVGEPVDVEAGARVDDRVSGPARIRGTLVSRHEGDPQAPGRIVVLAAGGLRIVLTEHRKAFHSTGDFADIGLDPRAADVIVTKIGYLEPTLHEIAEGWTLALTPGPVDQDLDRFGHRRIKRPMFPFDDFGSRPSLTPLVFGG